MFVRACATMTVPLSDVSRTSNVSVSAYLRTAQSLKGQEDMGNDILMARVDLTPVLDGHVSRAYRPDAIPLHHTNNPPHSASASPYSLLAHSARACPLLAPTHSMPQTNGTTQPLARERSI